MIAQSWRASLTHFTARRSPSITRAVSVSGTGDHHFSTSMTSALTSSVTQPTAHLARLSARLQAPLQSSTPVLEFRRLCLSPPY